VALAALITACATPDMNKVQESWQGAAYEDVLRAWGAPNRSTRTDDGRDWHTWANETYPAGGSSVGVP